MTRYKHPRGRVVSSPMFGACCSIWAKKHVVLLPLFLLLFCWPLTGFAAERQYRITETELARLEQNLTRQEAALLKALNLLGEQRTELAALKAELQAALIELEQSKAQIQSLKESLKSALSSIESANQSLKAYEREMKSRLRAAKWQRNAWAAGVVFMGAAYIAK